MTYFVSGWIDQRHFKEPLDVLVLPISAFLEDLIELSSFAGRTALLLDGCRTWEVSLFLLWTFASHLNL